MQPVSTFNRERNQTQRQFKSSKNQLPPLGEEQNFFQNGRSSKCLFEDGNQRKYMCEKIKNMSVKKRKDAIYQLKACFNCLKLGHSSKECPSTQSCRNCNKRHHTHLHDESSLSANSTHCNTSASSERPSLLQILPVKLSRDGKSIKTYAFLDNGSVVSKMLAKTASALEIVLSENSNHTEPYKVIHGTKSVTYTNVNLSIKGMNSNQTFNTEDVQVSPDIEFPQYNLEWIQKVCEQHEHLKHITYHNVDINQMSILIGCKNFDLITPRENHYGPQTQRELFRQNLDGLRLEKLICLLK